MLHVDSDSNRKEFDNYWFGNECLTPQLVRICNAQKKLLSALANKKRRNFRHAF